MIEEEHPEICGTTSIDCRIEFREVAKTHVIHAFDVVDGVTSKKAICGYEPNSGMSFPLQLEDVEYSLCKACLKRKSQ